MKIDVLIPTSAATRNFKICLLTMTIGLIMVLFELPSWAFTLMFAVSGAFLLSMVMCIFPCLPAVISCPKAILSE